MGEREFADKFMFFQFYLLKRLKEFGLANDLAELDNILNNIIKGLFILICRNHFGF